MSTTYIVYIVIAVIVLWAIAAYNNFVKLVHRTKEAWADIDVQLKRRYDLIPNLVEAVKGYAGHERATFDAVTEARAKATQIHIDPSNMTAESVKAMMGAEAGLGQALGKLLAVAEAYPDLKANANFAQLQMELSDTENKIQAARRFYNGNVQDLNTAVQSFPSNVIAGMFGFKQMDLFQLTDSESAAREPVQVSF